MIGKNNESLRVFIDTNVLISAVLSETSICAKLLRRVIEEHELLICSYTITEATKVIERKFPKRIEIWDKFLTSLEFEISYTPLNFSSMQLPPIRDQADLPILASAVIAQPDILVTGDLDFYTPEILEYFKVLTPADFLRHFNNEIDH
jgi:putative PIN family toxin of toxin-antitoxin system